MNRYYPPLHPAEPESIDNPRLPGAGYRVLLEEDFDTIEYGGGIDNRQFGLAAYGRCEGAE